MQALRWEPVTGKGKEKGIGSFSLYVLVPLEPVLMGLRVVETLRLAHLFKFTLPLAEQRIG